jgi:hypothetical protein
MKRKAIIIFSIMFLIGVTMVCGVVAQKMPIPVNSDSHSC